MKALDKDQGLNSKITYSVLHSDEKALKVHTSSGVIFLSEQFATNKKHFGLVVQASDNPVNAQFTRSKITRSKLSTCFL